MKASCPRRPWRGGVLALALLFLFNGCKTKSPSPGEAESPSAREAKSPSVRQSATDKDFHPGTLSELASFREVELKLVRLVHGGKRIQLPGSMPITLQFPSPNRIVGQSAVNRYFGSLQTRDDGTVIWPNAAFGLTRKSGSPEAMELENTYVQALTKTTEFLISAKGGFRFQNADQSEVVEFER